MTIEVTVLMSAMKMTELKGVVTGKLIVRALCNWIHETTMTIAAVTVPMMAMSRMKVTAVTKVTKVMEV